MFLKPKLSGLEAFGSKVLAFLKSAITRTYPDAKEVAKNENEENKERDAAEIYQDFIEEGLSKTFENSELLYFYQILRAFFLSETMHQNFTIAQKTNFFVGFEQQTNAVLEFARNGQVSSSMFKLYGKFCIFVLDARFFFGIF